MKYCFGDDAEFVAVKHYDRLQRELTEAREDAANQRRLADLALAHRDEIIKERDILERELNEVHNKISNLMQNQTIAMQELQEKWHVALKQRDILETALMIIKGYYVDGENTYEDWKAMGQTAKNALSRITLI